MPSFQNPSMTALGKDEEFLLQVARGHIPNHSVRNIFGYQASGDTTIRAVWEFAATNYVFPNSALQMEVVSASASDNDKLLLISGLDSDYKALTETITLNSSSSPTTSAAFFRINDVVLLTGTTNVGLITIQNDGVKYAGIRAGDGRNQASIYTVPAGMSFYLYRIDAFSNDGTSAKPAVFRNFSRTSAGQQYNTARTTFNNNMNIQRRLPFKYNEKTDIQFQVATLSGTHELAVFGEGILIEE